jgi:hypothetical protein
LSKRAHDGHICKPGLPVRANRYVLARIAFEPAGLDARATALEDIEAHNGVPNNGAFDGLKKALGSSARTAQAGLLHIPGETEHRFRGKVNTDSGAI